MNKKLTLKKAVIKNLGDSDMADIAGAGRFGRRIRRATRRAVNEVRRASKRYWDESVIVSTGAIGSAVGGTPGSPASIASGAAGGAIASAAGVSTANV